MFTQNAMPLAQKALNATVLLVPKGANDQILGYGSGFFVRNDQIVTNLHVVRKAKKCFAKLVGRETMYEIEGYTAINPENDLIILKVRDIDEPVVPLSLGNSVSVHIGETVYAVGNPKGYEGTVSDGIISGIRETDKLIQTTAPISRGSSGGPLINNNGEVIGVSVLSNTEGQNLNFVIPSNYVETLIAAGEGVTPKNLLFARLAGVTWIDEKLTWLESEHASNAYTFSLLNQRRYNAIKKIYCLVIFRDEAENPIHLDFVKFSGNISAGEKQEIIRHSIFDLLPEEEIGNHDVDDIFLAAVVFGSRDLDSDVYSLVTPEVKQLTKTYEVRIVNFDVVE